MAEQLRGRREHMGGIKLRCAGLCAVLMILAAAHLVMAGEDETVVGRISANFQIVTESYEIYKIEDSGVGRELVSLVGHKVRVKGTVEEAGGDRVIRVTSYEIMED